MAMLGLLAGSQNGSLSIIARWCALPKFAIVGVGALYLLLGGMRWLQQLKSINSF